MMATQIIYNGTVIGTVTEGQSKILKCNGKKMKSDVEIRAGERTEIKYDGAVIATVEAGSSKTIKCAGKTMKSNIEIRVEDDTPGKEGVSPTVEMIDIEGGTRIIITDVNGPKSADIMDGKDGPKGDKGDPGADGKDGSNGVGIKSVVQTTTSSLDGGSNVITVTKTDNTTSTFTVKNGREGSDGKDGYTPIKGVDYFDGLNGSDGRDGKDGKTPVKGVDYYTEADKSEFSEYIASELAKRGQLSPEFAESLEWLKANGDQSKMYVLPDGMIWAYMLTASEPQPLFDNILDNAIGVDGQPYEGGKGYKEGWRINSSKVEEQVAGNCITGYIPMPDGAKGQTLRFMNMPKGTKSVYILYYKSDFTAGNSITYESAIYASPDENGVYSVTLANNDYTAYIRVTAGDMSETIITIDEEIKWSEGGTGNAWASTGRAFVPADYEDRIVDLERETERNTADIETLKKGAVDPGSTDVVSWMREWDSPIYDRTPVWELTNEKSALTASDKTVAAVYAKYDALMAQHPDFITKTDLGLCSDGVTHVYRYDFKEREPRHQSGFEWSEKKPKFIVVTGIHREWNGIYGMFHALSEIATNSDLAELRRSVHFIVVPVLNPYSISGDYSTVGHAANANGVEIHRNFEVGFTVAGEGTIHYTGASALSEVESQYLDNILKSNTDAAYFLTCHSFDRDKTWGVGFLWGSSATKYMCNMAFRVIDKMGKAWHKKYGKIWEDGIKAQNEYLLANIATYPNATALEDGDYRIGHAALTNTGGCEQRQATKYGIQATNFEVGETFFVLDETSLSAKAITHGAEAYVNFFLTAMGVYDHKDKKEYAPNLP